MDDISQLVDSARSYRIQETPYFKRLRMREESDLRHLREAEEIVEQSAKDFLDMQMRRIRLNKLYEDINNKIVRNAEINRYRRPSHKSNKLDELKATRVIQARQKGNEYSKKNRNQILYTNMLRNTPLTNHTTKDNDKKNHDALYHKRKLYGQEVSNLNMSRIHKKRINYMQTDHLNEATINYHKKFNYGSYYTKRNRLRYKDTLGEFDDEYADLLSKCVAFEKEHLDVCGFLEEKLKSNYGEDLKTILAKLPPRATDLNLRELFKVNNNVSTLSILSEPDVFHESIESDLEPLSPNSLLTANSNTSSQSNTSYLSREIFKTTTRVEANKYPKCINYKSGSSDQFKSQTTILTTKFLNSVQEENEDDFRNTDLDISNTTLFKSQYSIMPSILKSGYNIDTQTPRSMRHRNIPDRDSCEMYSIKSMSTYRSDDDTESYSKGQDSDLPTKFERTYDRKKI